jgi:hypothetical protein
MMTRCQGRGQAMSTASWSVTIDRLIQQQDIDCLVLLWAVLSVAAYYFNALRPNLTFCALRFAPLLRLIFSRVFRDGLRSCAPSAFSLHVTGRPKGDAFAVATRPVRSCHSLVARGPCVPALLVHRLDVRLQASGGSSSEPERRRRSSRGTRDRATSK